MSASSLRVAREQPASARFAGEIETFTTGESVSVLCHKMRQFVRRKSLLTGGRLVIIALITSSNNKKRQQKTTICLVDWPQLTGHEPMAGDSTGLVIEISERFEPPPALVARRQLAFPALVPPRS